MQGSVRRSVQGSVQGESAGRSRGFDNPVARLAAVLVPGVFTGLLSVVLSVSFASLIFRGPLAAYLPQGITMAIAATVVLGVVIGLLGRAHPVVAMADEDTAPIFALMASLIVAALPAGAAGDTVFATVAVGIVATTALTGLGLYLLGRLRLGRVVEFLPHSVTGGYFAALGWLLLVGGLEVCAPHGLDRGGDWSSILGAFERLTDAAALWSWLPAVAMAAWLLVLRGRVSRALLLPGTVLLAAAAWFTAARTAGMDVEVLSAAGLLIGPFADHGAFPTHPLAGVNPGQVQPGALLNAVGSGGTVVLISVLSLLFTVQGLGLASSRDPDVDRELRLAGAANLLGSLGGALTALPSYTLSRMGLDMGAAANRWPGLVAAAVAAAALVFAMPLLGLAPRFVLGGLLVYLGASLLREWLFETRRKYSTAEYLVIPLIVVVSVAFGFMVGVLVGLLAAIVLFVVRYSRIRVIRFTASGSDINSNVDRNDEAQAILERSGGAVWVLGLQGYLFFGTAGSVYEALKRELAGREPGTLRYLVIDFDQVTGIDASAALNFQRIERLAEREQIELVLSDLRGEPLERLTRGGFADEGAQRIVFMPNLDHALEWTENRLLEQAGERERDPSCFDQIRSCMRSDEDLRRLKTYLTARTVEAGDVIVREGDESTELVFCETVAASAFVRHADGTALRVRTTERGTVYGELGLYQNVRRTATIRADEAGTIFVLTLEALERLETEAPEVASGLHRYMARILAERLMNTTQTLKALQL